MVKLERVTGPLFSFSVETEESVSTNWMFDDKSKRMALEEIKGKLEESTVWF